MIFIKSFLLLFSTFSFAQPLEFNKLGSRPSECRSNPDTHNVVIASDFVTEAQEMFDKDTLKAAIIAGDPCYRVGTEVSLELDQEGISYLGKAYLSKLKKMDAKDLLADSKLHVFKKASIEDFVAKNPNKKFNLVHFRVMEKISNMVMKNTYDRLPSCFVSYGDWKSMRLSDDKWEEELKGYKDGSHTADIWNGTRNCFKVGIKVELEAKGVKEKLGWLEPTKLYLTHYTQITEEQAQHLGENLSELKERLAKEKDKFGGYTTMVVYDYIPATPIVR